MKIFKFFMVLVTVILSSCGSMNRVTVTELSQYKIQTFIPLYHHKLLYYLPAGWRTVTDKNFGDDFVGAYAPPGQTANNWSQLIVITGIKGASGIKPVKEIMLGIGDGIKEGCPSSYMYQEIGASIVDGNNYFEAIMNCSANAGDEKSDGNEDAYYSAYYLIAEGKKDVYTIEKRIRPDKYQNKMQPLSINNYMKFIEALTPVSICSKKGNRTDCNT